MAKKRKTKAQELADAMARTRERTWVIKPITQVIPNKKAKQSKKACRGKVVE